MTKIIGIVSGILLMAGNVYAATIIPTPESATILLLGAGLIGVSKVARRMMN